MSFPIAFANILLLASGSLFQAIKSVFFLLNHPFCCRSPNHIRGFCLGHNSWISKKTKHF
ncbi:hypothetical protein A7Q10_10075 [Methylacidiphilum caldifontis]|uniref:Uncharacterized protein n=1 Tax=Methylacidiphilum caldifontis TaxID=2795386 RepID=A0A4Y8P9P5_9BACT|nr:hypothetical protein A7Q10_10075 [Methylacidiphilum caldifontis]